VWVVSCKSWQAGIFPQRCTRNRGHLTQSLFFQVLGPGFVMSRPVENKYFRLLRKNLHRLHLFWEALTGQSRILADNKDIQKWPTPLFAIGVNRPKSLIESLLCDSRVAFNCAVIQNLLSPSGQRQHGPHQHSLLSLGKTLLFHETLRASIRRRTLSLLQSTVKVVNPPLKLRIKSRNISSTVSLAVRRNFRTAFYMGDGQTLRTSPAMCSMVLINLYRHKNF
jgi:hypothetical protein